MDLTSPTQIKELLEKYHRKPSKGLGQNFLVNAPTLQKIVEAADLQDSDTVIEVGPGLGTLTQALATRAKKVIAIEKDRAMMPILKETLAGAHNVEMIQGDVLESANYVPPTTSYKLVANVPYYITSPIIRMFLEAPLVPETIVLMIQKEVAQRICAKPPKMSILAVSVQFYATAQIISYVSKGCFWPKPTVDSAIIKIVPYASKPLVEQKQFFEVVKAGFIHPRKQLANNFATTFKKPKAIIEDWLIKNNLNPLQRAETLRVEDWVNLTQSFPK